ncbi:topology modulation protein [Sphingomonas sp. SUN019]|uniref:topology modulation protein n=1 Tax=Sphingomonas sp. SUN019 TaxID=2937788 RepID=UPI002164A067|nr:topology modulation protein [Sphingomonas sp. SUN019]UVO50056.1 topology modulation protein [Sphingomonas sp. SUN019]
MRRVMILGSPGSGKSTLARRLGKLLDVPVFHLDRVYHRPGWTPPPDGEFADDVARIAGLPAWVIDGNYASTAASRLRAADTIIYLDVSRRLAMARILRRIVLHYGRQRPDSAEGCPERFDAEFLRYVWNWERDVAMRVRWLLVGFPGRTITLASKRDVRRFTASL